MQTLVDIFVQVFGIFNSIQILNIPLLVWAIIPVLIGLVIQFIKGKKE